MLGCAPRVGVTLRVFVALVALVVATALADSAQARPAEEPEATPAPIAPFVAPTEACKAPRRQPRGVVAQVQTMRCLVNWARLRRGLPSLRVSSVLDRSARLKATAIDQCQDFSHTACGLPLLWVFDRAGYLAAGGTVAENLAWGSRPNGGPRRTLESWLGSTGHRENLFGRDWRDLGVAVVKAKSLFGAPDVAVWVTEFGTRG